MGPKQTFGGCFANRADSQFVERTGLMVARLQATQEIFDAVNAGEDDPVIAVEVIHCFVEPLVTFGLGNFNGGTKQNARAVMFQRGDKIGGLGASPSDHDHAASEWLSFGGVFYSHNCLGQANVVQIES